MRNTVGPLQFNYRYGYAPKSEAMYSSDALRKAAREKQFGQMDRESKGYITLEQVIDN